MNDARRVTWLTACSHFLTHGYMSLFPALLVAITGEHAASFLLIGLIANVSYFLYGLGSIPAGILADRFGSKRVLSVGVLGMSVSSLLVGVIPGVAGFAVAYALLGLFSSIHHPAGLAFIARRVTERKGRTLGIHGVLGNVGLFLTPLAASACILLFSSWRAAYILYGLVGLCFFVILHRTKISGEEDFAFALDPWRQAGGKDSVAVDATGAAAKKAEASIPVSLLFLLFGSIMSGFIFRGSLTYFPALLQREVLFINSHAEPVVAAGFATTAVLSLGLIGAWFGGWINDKVKAPEYVPAVVLGLVSPLLYLLSRNSDNALLATGCFFSLIYYAWQPSQNYLIGNYTKKSSHGKGFGVNFFFLFGMGSAATAVGGYFVDNLSVDRFYAFMAWIALAASLVALFVYPLRFWRLRYAGGFRILRDPSA